MPENCMIKLIIAALIGVLAVGVPGCGRQKVIVELSQTETAVGTETAEAPVSLDPQADPEDEVNTSESSGCVVHICGAVENPGVYSLLSGSRICDAVNAAGGLTEDAAQEYVNLAAQIADGQQIRIPDREEIEQMTAQSGGIDADAGYMYEATVGNAFGVTGDRGQTDDGLVDINHATKEQLCTLPGIGEAKAAAIMAYREANGSFETIEEIMKVDGIKEAGFKRLKDYITVR